jgi:hypothetical protein
MLLPGQFIVAVFAKQVIDRRLWLTAHREQRRKQL